MSVRPSFIFVQIGTYPVLQHHFTGVRTVSPTAGLDMVMSLKKFVFVDFIKVNTRIASGSLLTSPIEWVINENVWSQLHIDWCKPLLLIKIQEASSKKKLD